MALNVNDFFTPRANPPDANYTTGSFKDRSLPGELDGTPLLAADRNDIQGFTDALLALADITHSGAPDTALASDRLEALKIIIRARTGYIYVTGGGQLEINERYLIGDSDTYTLPDTSSLTLKDRVEVAKIAAVTPVIEVFDDLTEVINFYRPAGDLLLETDTSVSYNIYSPLIFIFNTNWDL